MHELDSCKDSRLLVKAFGMLGAKIVACLLVNGADGKSDIEHVAIGNRAGSRQRSWGSWRKARGSAIDQGKVAREAASELGSKQVSMERI